MNRFYWNLWLVGALLWGVYGELFAQHRSIRVMTYNVENLFDTCKDARFNDQEFLPDGSRAWNTGRYRQKLSQIARVIATAGGPSPVELVALCEVENDSVLHDLTRRTYLVRLGYQYVVTHSNDSRGLDVALLYQPERFRVLSTDVLRIPYRKGKELPTRDILHVLGRLPSGDSLDMFVCHFPSRSRGQKTTESYRLRAAQCVRTFVDSIEVLREQLSVVVLGDFNDEPENLSFTRGMRAVGVSKIAQQGDVRWAILSDTLQALDGKVVGTYYYKHRWNRLDHIIVNSNMLWRTEGVRVKENSCKILAYPFLLRMREDDSDDLQMNRTYSGAYYRGGVSDHLPLMVELMY